MKLDRAVFAIILMMCAVTALTALWPEAGGMVEHPEHATMRHGGPVETGQGGMLWLGWLFGVTILLVFVTLIAFGAGRHLRRFSRRLTLATAAVIASWTWVIVAYRAYLGDPEPELYLALPAPTAIMAYLFLPLTLVFVLFFVIGFRHFVLPDGDLETYERLLGADRPRPESSTDETS